MAKRYKKNKKNKVNKTKILLFFLILVIIICIVFFWDNNTNESNLANTNTSESSINKIENGVLQNIIEEIKKEDNKLSSDLLEPEEVCKEVKTVTNDKIGNGYIVKINYQLKNLEEGKVFLYYKLEDNNVVLIEVDIASKQIQSIENYDGNDLAEKLEIKENLKTDVKEYYEENQSGLLDDEYRVNILITNTDIISNIIVV